MRKNKKLFVATLLAVPAVAVVADDMKASADTGIQEGTVIVPGNYPQTPARQMLNMSSTAATEEVASIEEMKEFLLEQMKSYNSGTLTIKFTNSSSNWTSEKLKVAVQQAFNEILNAQANRYIEGTYNGHQYTFNYQNNSDASTGVANITMNINYLTTLSAEAETGANITNIAAELAATATTPFQKVKAVHDYMINKYSYSSTNVNNKSPHTISTLTNEKKGSAQAYALMTYRLLKQLGVSVDYVTGTVNGSPHIWNLVQLDANGPWYHLDILMDDTVFSGTENSINNTISYKNFLVGGIGRTLNEGENYSAPLATEAYDKTLNKIQAATQIGNELYYTDYSGGESSLKKLELETVSTPDTLKVGIDAKYIQFYNGEGGWLYFSDSKKNGHLYKLPITATNQDTDVPTLVVNETITSLRIAGSILTYTTANATELVQLQLEELEPIVKDADLKLRAVEEATTDNLEYDYKIVKALVALDKLTLIQKESIKNKVITNTDNTTTTINRLAAFDILAKSRRVIANGITLPHKYNDTMIQIEKIDLNSSNFISQVIGARTTYDGTDTSEQAKVKNSSKLVEAEALRNTYVANATAWHNQVTSFNQNTPYTAIIAARTAYDKMTVAQRAQINESFYNILTTQETKMAEEKALAYPIDYRIRMLNDRQEGFIDEVAAIRALVDSTTIKERSKAVISTSLLNAAETKVTSYLAQAKTFVNMITAWDSSYTTSTQVDIARTQYNGFNAAQREAVALYVTENNPGIDLATLLWSEIDKVAQLDISGLAVAKMIDALNLETMKLTDFTPINTAFTALSEEQKLAITSGNTSTAQKWVNVNTKINSSETDATTMIARINNLHSVVILGLPGDSSISITGNALTDLKSLLEDYDKLIGLTKEKVLVGVGVTENLQKLRVKYAELEVDDLIDELVIPANLDELYLTSVAKVREAYDQLPELSKSQVLNSAKLFDIEVDIVELKIAQIPDPIMVTEGNREKLDVARDALEALKVESKPKVKQEKIDRLEKLEGIYGNLVLAGLTGTASPQELINARKLLDALTSGARVHVDQVKITRLEELEAAIVDVDEKAVAKLVNDAIIAAYPNKETITREDYDALQVKYNSLDDKEKIYVTAENKTKLEELEVAVKAREEADQAEKNRIEALKDKAKPVINLIDKLTASSSKEKLAEARAAYEALEAAVKPYVTNLDKLVELEGKLTEKEADDLVKAQALALENQINGLSSVSTLDEILAVKAAYDALNEKSKNYVPASALTKLTSLLASKQQEHTDLHAKAQAEALIIVNRIDRITTSTTSKTLRDIRIAYDALSDLAKSYVTNLARLVEYEAYQKYQDTVVAAAKLEAVAFDSYMAKLNRNSTTDEIAKARAYYNVLSAEAKKHVTTYEKLVHLETMWSDPDYINLYVSYYPHYIGQQPSGGIEITKPTFDPLYIPDAIASLDIQEGVLPMDYRNGGYTATIFATDVTGIEKQKLTLTASSNVELALPIKELKALKNMPVTVGATLGYKTLTVNFTEGYTAKTFSDFVEITVSASELSTTKNAAIFRKLANGKLEAVSYQLKNDKFMIKTKTGGTFVAETISTGSTVSNGYNDTRSNANRTYINELAKRGIVSGDTKANYYPNQNITRGDFAIMIARAANLTSTSTTKFTDVSNTTNANLIQAVSEAGIMKGSTTTRFNINGTITREEAAVALTRLFRHLKMDVALMHNEQQSSFKDIANLTYESKNSIALMELLGNF